MFYKVNEQYVNKILPYINAKFIFVYAANQC